MSDNVVERLRDWEHVWLEDEDEREGGLYLKAADRIEELSNCVAVLEAKLSESEALLAKAIKSLEVIEDASRFYARDRESSDTETLSYAHETTRRLCSTTLAGIKGEK